MSYAVISCSLNPQSRSRLLAYRAAEYLRDKAVDVEFADLQEITLPKCDGGACYEDPAVQQLSGIIRRSEGVLVATPIYNYSASASVVNLVELTGQAWLDKVVGFLCAAGGPHSYMGILSLANSLMLDFRSIVVPRFVYTVDAAFDGNAIVDPAIEARIDELTSTLIRIGRALGEVPAE